MARVCSSAAAISPAALTSWWWWGGEVGRFMEDSGREGCERADGGWGWGGGGGPKKLANLSAAFLLKLAVRLGIFFFLNTLTVANSLYLAPFPLTKTSGVSPPADKPRGLHFHRCVSADVTTCDRIKKKRKKDRIARNA